MWSIGIGGSLSWPEGDDKNREAGQVKIGITGAGGQLGRDLIRVLQSRHELVAWTHQDLSITDEKAVEQAFALHRPDAVIHAAAYTGVDAAEKDLDTAYMVNAFGTRHVAWAAHGIGAKMVYISTDYVFDGRKGVPYTEGDRTAPLGIYGNSKLLGEKFTEFLCDRHFIVRTSWLYGLSGSNFVTKVLQQAKEVGTLRMVSDQYGSPTYTLDLASQIAELIETEEYGVYHVSNRGFCSRFRFAEAILEIAGLDGVKLEAVEAGELSLPAERPAHSGLSDQALRRRGFGRMRHWKSALEAFIREDLQRSDKGEGGPEDDSERAYQDTDPA